MLNKIEGPALLALADVAELFEVAGEDRLTPGQLADGLRHRRRCWEWWNAGSGIEARDVEGLLRGVWPDPDGFIRASSVRTVLRLPEVREMSEAAVGAGA